MVPGPAVVDGEQRARKCGRRFAKQIFQAPLPQWRLIGTHATDHVEIFEEIEVAPPTSTLPSATGTTRRVRAVRKLSGFIDDAETVLRASHKSQLYAKLVPELYASGGCITDYGLLKHASNEREYTNVQFAMHFAHVWQSAESGHAAGATSAAAAASHHRTRMDHQLYLEYLLMTQLQRTQVAVQADGTTASVTTPVPSLLYVLRPVQVPSFSDRHHEFKPHCIAQNTVSVSYVVQQEDKGTLSLEVVLTCSFAEPEQFASVRASHTSEMWRIVVALTRLQPLIDGVRLGREQAQGEQQRRRTVPSTDIDPSADPFARRAAGSPARGTSGSSLPQQRASTRLKVKHKLFGHRRTASGASGFETDESEDESDQYFGGGNRHGAGGGCAVCRKRFHAFRWKKKCEVCLQGVCDHCLSTIANAAAMRKKKRVCAACLYGGTNSGFERITQDTRSNADVARDAMRAAQDVRNQRARTIAEEARHSPSDRSSSVRRSDGRRRAQTSAARAAPQAATAAPTLVRASPTPPTPTAVSSSWASEEQSTLTNPESEIESSDTTVTTAAATTAEQLETPYKSNSFFDETDPSGIVSDDEFVMTTSTRARRAQTIEIGEVDIKRVEKRSRSNSRASPSPHSSRGADPTRARGRSFSSDRTPFDLSEFTLRLSTTKSTEPAVAPPSSSVKRSGMQFRQLKTPSITYDLDFDWINPFPKAPLPTGVRERERVDFMASQLKLNAHTAMVYLRRDAVLEELTQTVAGSLATQWDGCSIHLIGERQVFCLAYSYQEPLPVSDEAVDVVTEDVVSREECASSYALYHQSAFFVPNLNDDVRFRAHPLHTDAHVVSYLSLPIYGSAGSRSCMGTLDLWRFDPSGVSSHVSHDWWSKMERVLAKIAARIEELSLAHASHTMPSLFTNSRIHKTRSVGSSGSRGSTRKDDASETSDLRDLAEEEELRDDDEEEYYTDHAHDADHDDSDTEYELHGGWTSSPVPVAVASPSDATEVVVATTRPRRHTVTDHHEMRSRSNDNGSFVGGNRGSAASASSLDFESTIESLLNQARRTSQFVRETSRRSSNVDIDC